ncbi:MAG: PorP/SprF family type IX secretion system membrane protein [Paludibacteraceae bacterium]|nr:PorP/SprF family type IX secretion system membrane protein [Paludibacteraceae bacterium]
MKYLFRVLCSVWLGTIFMTVNAQQDVLLSQEYFSRVNKNPAATGNTNDLDIFLYGRLQWVGIENAPKTSVLNVTNYIEKIQSGFGLSAWIDAMGVGRYTSNAKLIYNYQFNLNATNILSLGLGAGMNMVSLDPSVHSMDDETDDSYLVGKETKISPDFNVGMEWNNPHFSCGLSTAHVTYRTQTTFMPGRHLYVYVSVPCQFSDKLDMIPTFSFMRQNGNNVMDVAALFFLKRSYWAGVSWRPDLHDEIYQSMVSFSIGFEVKKFRLGYSFDLGLGTENLLPSNTHEVMLSYGIEKKRKK